MFEAGVKRGIKFHQEKGKRESQAYIKQRERGGRCIVWVTVGGVTSLNCGEGKRTRGGRSWNKRHYRVQVVKELEFQIHSMCNLKLTVLFILKDFKISFLSQAATFISYNQ